MRIVYLHQYFLTPQMSGGTRSYELARRLVKAGHTVDVVTSDQQASSDFRGWRLTEESGVRVHWASVPYNNRMGPITRIRAFVRFAVAATRKARKFDADVIFATSTPLTIAIPAMLTAWSRRIPFVFEVRDLWPDVPIAIGAIRNPLIVAAARRLEITTYRRAQHIVALAPGMREEIVAKHIPPEKVSVVPNGADIDVFGVQEGPDPRIEHDWLGRNPMVLFAGTLGVVNGVDYLIRLAAEVRTIAPEVRFVVLGDGSAANELEALAKRLGVLGESVFLLGRTPKVEVARWLRTADMSIALFTGPRIVWKDAVQNKFFDSLAAGVPIANNFDGWQSQIAEEADCGITLDAFDLKAAARELVGRLHDREWLDRASANARDLAQGRFNRDRQAVQLEAILEQAVGAR
jgi:glycosyltransferase involved in cell wall biosynthesis